MNVRPRGEVIYKEGDEGHRSPTVILRYVIQRMHRVFKSRRGDFEVLIQLGEIVDQMTLKKGSKNGDTLHGGITRQNWYQYCVFIQANTMNEQNNKSAGPLFLWY